MKKRVKGKDLLDIGFPQNKAVNIALGQISRYMKKEKKEQILNKLKDVLKNPAQYEGVAIYGKIAEALKLPEKVKEQQLKTQRAPFHIFGNEHIQDEAKFQLYNALKLPVSVAGALMPDAHSGYGLPIGGVLATKNAVIPYGVGVDIACRMQLSIFPETESFINGRAEQLKNALSNHTKFGMYETHDKKQDHALFENKLFSEIPLLKSLHGKAYKQLGTSGGGNHFVEFGTVSLENDSLELGLKKGNYFALLSHSGSRGLGASIAKHYSYLAEKQCPLPKQVQHLAWLNLDSHDGAEYWLAMQLAGEYAKACHDNIHARLAKVLGLKALTVIDNHHNFAWKETINGEEVVVHRKGATPAKDGELGIIPGSMASKGFIVKGKGNEASLQSASHGAGRLFSRAKCKSKFTQSDMKQLLKNKRIELIGGSIDEAPMAYKDIHEVMQNQTELVDVLGVFEPKIVRMDK